MSDFLANLVRRGAGVAADLAAPPRPLPLVPGVGGGPDEGRAPGGAAAQQVLSVPTGAHAISPGEPVSAWTTTSSRLATARASANPAVETTGPAVPDSVEHYLELPIDERGAAVEGHRVRPERIEDQAPAAPPEAGERGPREQFPELQPVLRADALVARALAAERKSAMPEGVEIDIGTIEVQVSQSAPKPRPAPVEPRRARPAASGFEAYRAMRSYRRRG